MNGRERVLAMLGGREPDRLPLMPITMMFAADQTGARYRDYARDYRVLAEAQAATAEKFDLDYVSAISDPAREASDLGRRSSGSTTSLPRSWRAGRYWRTKHGFRARAAGPGAGPRMS